jgi:hypothetical protein
MTNHSKSWYHGLFDLVLLIVLIPFMFLITWFVGAAYIITILGLLFSGTIFKKKGLVMFVLIGTILSLLAWMIFPFAVDSFSTGDYVSFAILSLFAIAVWFIGFKMKKGK